MDRTTCILGPYKIVKVGLTVVVNLDILKLSKPTCNDEVGRERPSWSSQDADTSPFFWHKVKIQPNTIGRTHLG